MAVTKELPEVNLELDREVQPQKGFQKSKL
jgi:hypothetical protein